MAFDINRLTSIRQLGEPTSNPTMYSMHYNDNNVQWLFTESEFQEFAAIFQINPGDSILFSYAKTSNLQFGGLSPVGWGIVFRNDGFFQNRLYDALVHRTTYTGNTVTITDSSFDDLSMAFAGHNLQPSAWSAIYPSATNDLLNQNFVDWAVGHNVYSTGDIFHTNLQAMVGNNVLNAPILIQVAPDVAANNTPILFDHRFTALDADEMGTISLADQIKSIRSAYEGYPLLHTWLVTCRGNSTQTFLVEPYADFSAKMQILHNIEVSPHDVYIILFDENAGVFGQGGFFAVGSLIVDGVAMTYPMDTNIR